MTIVRVTIFGYLLNKRVFAIFIEFILLHKKI